MRTREFILLFFIIDLILLNVSITLAAIYRGAQLDMLWPDKLTILLNGSSALVYIIYIDDMKHAKVSFWRMVRCVLQKSMTFIAIAAIVMIWMDLGHVSRIQFLGSIFMFSVLKLALYLFLFKGMSLRNNKGSKVIIVGDGSDARQIYKYCLENPYLGYEPIGMLSERKTPHDPENVLGTLDDFQHVYDKHEFQVAIITIPLEEGTKIKQLISISERNGVRPRIIPNWYNVIHRNFTVNAMGAIPMLDMRNVPLYHYPNRFWKRAFDIALAGGAMVILSPLMALIALAIKLQDGGSILYTPVRLGVNNKPFKLYKFRSMSVNDNSSNGTLSTILNDNRITPLGRFLRKSNLDELPQLYNVLRNEMSIIGPRPHRVFLNRTLQQKVSNYMLRHSIKPGITGWAQVHGWRGPTESKIQYMGRTLHDLWYIEHWSFAVDLYIIFLTAFGKKTRKNAF
jgi:putative colanic acid biosysnthesis UDP-glucose lipid carrier transferase